MVFVLRTNSAQNEDRVVWRRIIHLHGLEAALEGGVLLNMLTVFGQGRRTDALDFAAGQRWLEDIGGIHRAFGRTSPHDGVHFVDEQDDVLGALDLVHDPLDALFELAAVLGASDHEGEV